MTDIPRIGREIPLDKERFKEFIRFKSRIDRIENKTKDK